jgi:hypothetical protein
MFYVSGDLRSYSKITSLWHEHAPQTQQCPAKERQAARVQQSVLPETGYRQ